MFYHAADYLHLTQSFLICHIQKMESDLSVKFFERAMCRIRLSQYGNLILSFAQQIADLETVCSASLAHEQSQNKNLILVSDILVMFQYQIANSRFPEE